MRATNLFILISGDSDKLRLFEYERLDRRPGNFNEIIRFDDVQARLIAMHGVEDGLNGARANHLSVSLPVATGVIKRSEIE
jgi:hypothetical protein